MRGTVWGTVWVVVPWLVLAALLTAVHWRDGTVAVPRLEPFALMLTLTPAFVLLLMARLHREGGRALASFRELLEMDDAAFERFRRRFSAVPAGRTLRAILLGGAVGLASSQLWRDPTLRLASRAWASPLATGVEITALTLYWMVLGAFVARVLHQLRGIAEAYEGWTRVSLFRLEPAYAFSRVTALAAVGTLVVAYGWVFAAPELYRLAPGLALYPFGFSALAVAVFAAPLTGAHRSLRREKQARLAALHARHERALEELRDAAERRDAATLGVLDKVMTALDREQGVIERISTWPWRPETPRWFATAVVVPLGVFVVQRVLTAVFGW